MAPKGTPKSKTNQTNWILCEKCNSSITNKDAELHLDNCPPNITNPNHPFVKENLYGILQLKSNETIKGISLEQMNTMVFLSQSAMQICNFAIGDLVLIRGTMENVDKALVCLVWPTLENKMTSVLLTKEAVSNMGLVENQYVVVSKLKDIQEARKVTLVLENGPKNIDINNDLQTRLSKSHVNQCTRVGNVLKLLFYGRQLQLRVKEILPKEIVPNENSVELHEALKSLKIEENCAEFNKFYKIVENTNLIVFKNPQDYEEIKQRNRYNLNQLGGLEKEIQEITNLIQTALKPKKENAIKPIKGVLLYGQSGTGKTHLVKSLSREKSNTTVEINALDLYSKHSGGNLEENLKKMFSIAKINEPALIIMDEIDVLCPQRSSRLTEGEKRIVSCILTELDFILNSDYKIFVIGVTNKLESVEPALRRCGRFDRELEIPVPSPSARLAILKIITKGFVSEEVLKSVSHETHGFVGADLITLCSTAQLNNATTDLNFEDFKYALTKIRPSAMREVQIEVPNVKWTDIGGQEKLKLILKQCVEWPLKHPESFQRLGITPPRGVLMYGPPGCSKTMIAKALATESSLNFLSIKGPELFSKWVGESEKAIREVFRKARLVAPSVIFFDEIDALGGERTTGGGSSSSVQERVLAQLLTELDGVTDLGDVTVLAATNRPDRIDGALLRPGRLDRLVYVPLPEKETRREIFKIKLGKMSVNRIDIDLLVDSTDNYSGAELTALCHEAAMLALEENLDAECVQMEHFSRALKLVTPRTSSSMIKMYDCYRDNKRI